MGRVVDITEKLSFNSNPKLMIKGNEYEVNADAESVLKVMGIVSSNPDATVKALAEAYSILFPKKERDRISKLKLQFNDFETVVYEAIDLIIGKEDNEGEQ